MSLSTLEPQQAPREEFLRSPGSSYAANMYAAQAAGLQACHVTAGLKSPAGGLQVPWVEAGDAAGRPARLTARLEAKGSCHYFAQPVWPTRNDELEPFHGMPLSPYGMRQQQGHYEQGAQSPQPCEEVVVTPRSPPTNGRRPTSAPKPVSPRLASAAVGRTKPSIAHRNTFDGVAARTLITGGPQ